MRYFMGFWGAVLLVVFAAPPPAAAGELAPQLQALAARYAQAPRAVVVAAAQALPGSGGRGIFQARVTRAGDVQVYIHYRAAQPSEAALAGLGASGVTVSPRLHVVQAWLPISRLHAVSALERVTRIAVPAYGVATGGGEGQPSADSCAPVAGGLAIDNEAIGAEKVYLLQPQNITGAGVKIGIISDGVDCLASSRTAGYLPAKVFVPSGSAGSGDEGTAMLEEAHAMAPDSGLAFCGVATTVDFLQCYDKLQSWGANVISDDFRFFVALLYNDPDALSFLAAIKQFARDHPDISLTTCDFNDRVDYLQGAYQADASPTHISLTPSGFTPNPGGVTGRTYRSAMDFGKTVGDATDDVEKVVLSSGHFLFAELTWNDPLAGPYDDLDLFLLDAKGNIIQASTANQLDNSAGHVPAENIFQENDSGHDETFFLAALCFRCDHPIFVKLYGNMDSWGSFSHITDGGIGGHAALPEVMAVQGALAPSPSTSGVPATLYFFGDVGPFCSGDWVQGVTCSTAKPDVTAMTGVTVSGAGGFGFPLAGGGAAFFGTSAASPNVGAVIALLRSFAPQGEADADGWAELIRASANPTGVKDNDNSTFVGAGLVDSTRALALLNGDGLPVAVSGSLEVDAGQSASGTLVATDPDGGALVFALLTQPDHGRVVLDDSKTGAYTYTPDSGYAGGDIFAFKASDGMADSNTATVAILVKAGSDTAPVAEDGSLTTQENTSASGTLMATDKDGNPLSFAIVANPTHGKLTLDDASTGAYTYVPDSGYSGGDSFTFKANDGKLDSNVAQVAITVQAATPPPPPPSPSGDGGGGGSLAPFALAFLALTGLLAGYFRRRRKPE